MRTDIGTVPDAVDPTEARLLVSVGPGGTAVCWQGLLADRTVETIERVWLGQAGREKLIALLETAPLVGAP